MGTTREFRKVNSILTQDYSKIPFSWIFFFYRKKVSSSDFLAAGTIKNPLVNDLRPRKSLRWNWFFPVSRWISEHLIEIDHLQMNCSFCEYSPRRNQMEISCANLLERDSIHFVRLSFGNICVICWWRKKWCNIL